MKTLANNETLMALRNAIIAEEQEREAFIGAEVKRRERRILHAMEERRARRWNKVLGRRADGAVIRPIGSQGRYGCPVLSETGKAELRIVLRAEIEAESSVRCDGCDKRTAKTAPGWADAILCGSCTALMASTEGHIQGDGRQVAA